MKKREKDRYAEKKLIFIILRYLILILIIFSLDIIYFIATPLTVYPVLYSLKLFYGDVVLSGPLNNVTNLIIVNSISGIEIIPACIAGAAYLLLIILNLTVPMDYKKRTYSIISAIVIFLVLNIVRIVVFSIMYLSGNPYFDFTHKLFWYFISTLFVVGIWFLIVRKFKIKDIPIYSDVILYINTIRGKK